MSTFDWWKCQCPQFTRQFSVKNHPYTNKLSVAYCVEMSAIHRLYCIYMVTSLLKMELLQQWYTRYYSWYSILFVCWSLILTLRHSNTRCCPADIQYFKHHCFVYWCWPTPIITLGVHRTFIFDVRPNQYICRTSKKAWPNRTLKWLLKNMFDQTERSVHP